MNRTSLTSAIFAAALLGLGAGAYAASASDTIAARQGNFKTMGKSMKAISEQLHSPAPSLDTIKPAAVAIVDAAGKVDGYFPSGTGPEVGVKTEALPAIWVKRDEFRGDAAKLVQAAAAMQAAVDSGNIDAVKTQFAALGGTCKECHETFRAKES